MLKKLPNLQTLKLRGVAFQDFADLSALSRLTCLVLKKCGISYGIALPLTVTHLKLEWCWNEGIPLLQAFPALPKLRELSLFEDSWNLCQDILKWLLDPYEPRSFLLSHYAQRAEPGLFDLCDLKSLAIGTNSRSDRCSSLRNPRLFKVQSLSLQLPHFSDDQLQSVTGWFSAPPLHSASLGIVS
jgi:hypothetical protein